MTQSQPTPLMLPGDIASAGVGPQSHIHAHAAPPNPIHLVRRHLRGRLRYAVPLAAALGVVGAVGGYLGVPPMFRSQGLVDVSPTTQSLLRGENQQIMGGFEAFVEQQRAFISSRRVMDRALENEAMRKVGWPPGRDGLTLLQKRLEVAVKRRGDRIIVVAVEHPEAALAQAAVNSVLDAYKELYIEADATRLSDRERNLDDRGRQIQNDIDKIRREILNQGQGVGSEESLARLLEAKVGELARTDNQLASLSTEIARREKLAAGDALDPADRPPPDLDALADADIEMKRLLGYWRSLQSEYDSKRVALGPHHSEMRRLERALEAARSDVDKKAEAMVNMGMPGGANASKTPIPQLREAAARLRAQREIVSKEIDELNRKKSEIRKNQEFLADRTKALSENARLLDELRSDIKAQRESRGGRVSIAQNGDMPLEPSTDRRIPLAVGGGLGGAAAGFALVVVLGLVRPRYRYIDDVEANLAHAPLLGTLPELSSGEGEHDELAANSVHHLRNMLALSPAGAGADCTVYTITSAAPGDGKTSAAMALGMSFGAAGRRTLLIDADIYGRGLTKSMGMRGMPGLTDAALASKINGELRQTEFHNVWALPAGTGEHTDATILSKERVARILHEVRGQFDVVIIDTGPILGSVEGNLLAALSDGVVLMVSRGQDSKLVRACLKRLASIGAHCAGMVFNRATRVDFEHSMSHTSLRSRRQMVEEEAAPALQSGEPDPKLLRALGAPPGTSQSARSRRAGGDGDA